MSGNKAGGLKAKAANVKLYGPDYYAVIGAKGGKKSRGGGFTGDSERARQVVKDYWSRRKQKEQQK